MPTVEVTVRIGVPPEAVARVLLDAAKAPLWTAGLERLEVVSGEPGAAGCIGRAHYIEGGRRYTLDDVLEQVTPNRRYLSRVTGVGITATIETLLEPVGDNETSLRLRWAGTGTALRTWLLLPLIKGRIAQRAKADLLALRDLADGSAEPQNHHDPS